jgi:NhaP-type Na+/H+ or K+/H+ antiporter
MTDLAFLPTFPKPLDSFFLFGIVLLAGLIGGEAAARSRVLPRITGYIAIGLLLGPGALNLLSPGLVAEARIFVDISLGLILFELGRRLDLTWLKHDRWLLATGVAESALSFGLSLWALLQFGIAPLPAAMAASIGVATSPAVVLLVASELAAEGHVTRRAMVLTALNNVFALLIFTVLLPLVHLSFAAGWLTVLLDPAYRLGGSLLLGYLAYLLAIRLARMVGKREEGQFILLVGTIVLAVGGAKLLNLSVLLTLLSFGIMAKNLDRGRDLMEVEFGYAGQLFFVVLFVVVGATIRLEQFTALAALAFIGARFLGKAAAIFVFAPASRLTLGHAGLLGLGLLPMAGVALGMAQTVADIYPQFGAELAAIVASAVAILQLIGPVATRFAFKRAGEAHPDRR